jgi:hypothetical protein
VPNQELENALSVLQRPLVKCSHLYHGGCIAKPIGGSTACYDCDHQADMPTCPDYRPPDEGHCIAFNRQPYREALNVVIDNLGRYGAIAVQQPGNWTQCSGCGLMMDADDAMTDIIYDDELGSFHPDCYDGGDSDAQT